MSDAVFKTMDNGLRYTVFNTSQGWMGCLSSTVGLQRITLPQSTPQHAIEMMGGTAEQAVWSPDSFIDIIHSLTEYFSGKRSQFSGELDYGQATPFQKQVWEATRAIPYGETRSYSWVANRIGKPAAVRAVGQALGKNPLPIIVPCHRVIASNGTLCGFGGGLEMKRNLLRLEGASGSR
ncbi:MAG TPA: methylated-DNA--[protein]-cysteine S-methyltransferase [Dehalococcoidales bacterium]